MEKWLKTFKHMEETEVGMCSNNDHDRLAFYIKCRPNGVDLRSLVLQHHKVFIGYAPWRKGSVWDPHNVKASLLDISVENNDWNPEKLDEDKCFKVHQKQISENRGYARKIRRGDMVVLPRPGEGVCYIGRISDKFELVNDPPWAEEYLRLCKKHRLDCSNEADLIAEVVQSWPVEDWRPIAFPLIPRWISYSLLSRSTIGWLHDRPDKKLRVVEVLDQIYTKTFKANLEPTIDKTEVEGRLLNWITPSIFEHLICQLLQLENPKEHWLHIGGAGDGGVDGIAVNNECRVVAAVQCKWKFDSDPYKLGKNLQLQLQKQWGNTVNVYVAILYNEHKDNKIQSFNGVTLLNRERIAELLVKHKSVCSIAKTLGIA